MQSSSNEGSTGSEKDFDPQFQIKQLDKLLVNPTALDLRLLRGLITLPQFTIEKKSNTKPINSQIKTISKTGADENRIDR